jgi:signal transduction histidine kinase
VGSGTAFSDSDDRVAAVIDSLDEPALLLDDGDSVIHLNPEAAEALAVDRGQIIGKTLADDGEYRGASCARVLAALERAKTFPADEHQIDLNVRGRECIYFLKRALLRTSDNRSLGILVVLHEASKFREKSRAQDTTIVAAAQELNTPLTSLALAVGLLQREREKQNELIREITEDVDRLNHASADFLNMIREQPLPITFPSVGFDLKTLFVVISGKFEDRVARKQIEFAIHAEGNLQVTGDPLKLSWVIATLVGNALRHTPKAGKVDLIAEKEDRLIRITVRDNGPGIPPETRELVFGSSLRAADALQCLKGGFSLSIARQIAEAHGGRLFAERLPDGGCVTLTLPLSQES